MIPFRPAPSHLAMTVALALVAAAAVVDAARAQASFDVEMSRISGDPDAPRRHFRLRAPADVGDGEAESLYEIVLAAMREGYARSGVAAASEYTGWRRFNRAPYLSSTHGNHYVDNYANEIAARAYGKWGTAGELPIGSIIAKDSFAVTETNGLLLGPLFLMEKMPGGFNPVSGDWRYSVVLPDGTLFGETNGSGAERVEYCVSCHLAVEDQDHLYYVPRGYRVDPVP